MRPVILKKKKKKSKQSSSFRNFLSLVLIRHSSQLSHSAIYQYNQNLRMAHAIETSSSFMINPEEALPLFIFFVVCWLTTTNLSQTITNSLVEINDAKPFLGLLPRTHKNKNQECKEIGNKFAHQFICLRVL